MKLAPTMVPMMRQEHDDQEREHRHQDTVLEAGAAREASGDVAAYQEGQEQRYEEPYQARRTALGSPADAQDAEYPADDRRRLFR